MEFEAEAEDGAEERARARAGRKGDVLVVTRGEEEGAEMGEG
jgi:hypothetical protein